MYRTEIMILVAVVGVLLILLATPGLTANRDESTQGSESFLGDLARRRFGEQGEAWVQTWLPWIGWSLLIGAWLALAIAE
jgi:hypothetical protein